MNYRTIAMDGTASSGKSHIAELLAKRLDYSYLNSGSAYRAVTLLAMREGVDPANTSALIQLTKDCQIDFANNGSVTLLNGDDVSDPIRAPEIDCEVSVIANIPEIRNIVTELQRRTATNNNIIVEGRDTTTIVFPNANYKFYIDAAVESRAKHRYRERKEQDIETTLHKVESELRTRDLTDKNRKYGPLRRASDAVVIDTTDLTIKQATDFVLLSMEYKYDIDNAEKRNCCLCDKPVIVLNVEGNDMTFDYKVAAETGFVALQLHSFVCENWK